LNPPPLSPTFTALPTAIIAMQASFHCGACNIRNKKIRTVFVSEFRMFRIDRAVSLQQRRRRWVSLGGWCGPSLALSKFGVRGPAEMLPFDMVRCTLDGVDLFTRDPTAAAQCFFPPRYPIDIASRVLAAHSITATVGGTALASQSIVPPVSMLDPALVEATSEWADGAAGGGSAWPASAAGPTAPAIGTGTGVSGSSLRSSGSIVPLRRVDPSSIWLLFRGVHTVFTHFDLNGPDAESTLTERLAKWAALTQCRGGRREQVTILRTCLATNPWDEIRFLPTFQKTLDDVSGGRLDHRTVLVCHDALGSSNLSPAFSSSSSGSTSPPLNFYSSRDGPGGGSAGLGSLLESAAAPPNATRPLFRLNDRAVVWNLALTPLLDPTTGAARSHFDRAHDGYEAILGPGAIAGDAAAEERDWARVQRDVPLLHEVVAAAASGGGSGVGGGTSTAAGPRAAAARSIAHACRRVTAEAAGQQTICESLPSPSTTPSIAQSPSLSQGERAAYFTHSGLTLSGAPRISSVEGVPAVLGTCTGFGSTDTVRLGGRCPACGDATGHAMTTAEITKFDRCADPWTQTEDDILLDTFTTAALQGAHQQQQQLSDSDTGGATASGSIDGVALVERVAQLTRRSAHETLHRFRFHGLPL
jgi:hypothetical protein